MWGLLIDAREAMQIYLRVKLQPFFAAVDVCGSLQEATAMKHLHRYHCVFVHCRGIFADPEPYRAVQALCAARPRPRVGERTGRGRSASSSPDRAAGGKDRERERRERLDGDKEREEQRERVLQQERALGGQIKPRESLSRRVCVYGVPDFTTPHSHTGPSATDPAAGLPESGVTGEEMLAFVSSLLSAGVTDVLDELFTYEQIRRVVEKIF